MNSKREKPTKTKLINNKAKPDNRKGKLFETGLNNPLKLILDMAIFTKRKIRKFQLVFLFRIKKKGEKKGKLFSSFS